MTGDAIVRTYTRDELTAYRAQILDNLTCDEATLRAKAADWMLDATETAALTELNGIDYLLGN